MCKANRPVRGPIIINHVSKSWDDPPSNLVGGFNRSEKNSSKWEPSPFVGVKIKKNIWNHHLACRLSDLQVAFQHAEMKKTEKEPATRWKIAFLWTQNSWRFGFGST